MSDEGSGPDDDGTETVEEWRVRLAGASANQWQQKDLKFFEHIHPQWRSAEYVGILYALDTIFAKSRKRSATKVTSFKTNRLTDVPPPGVPFNLCIDSVWLEEIGKTKYPFTVDGFMARGNPTDYADFKLTDFQLEYPYEHASHLLPQKATAGDTSDV
ncbi:hypothetical protein SISSUDRAFT_1059881 [Sistotremastrum suecicum HHB10207 ss-3]|uniref:Uncharacterized protein n=1 Tax=Sistotremastrum suecicum HHB10207 ss-3 TaxID=1314776 RepID=A0A166FU07_9AGAM|nr:hypothetical protein SISSUDRAFT_1059881 [Sistotremastrum suecicum HHB10207 ss-3]